MNRWRLCGRAGGLAATVALLACIAAVRPASAEPAKATIGVFLTALNNLSLVTGTVIADFWMWTIADADRAAPLDTAYIVNEAAKTAEPIGTLKDGAHRWDQRRVRATLNQSLDISRFPFDRQTLDIVIEESFATSQDLVYVADREHSGVASSVSLPGWSVTGWNIRTEEHAYPTNFGDLEHPGPVQAARLIFSVNVKRQGTELFVDLSLGAFVAFLIMVLTFRMNPTVPPIFAGRMVVTAATIFTTLVSMRISDTVVAAPLGATVVDRIHLVTLAAGFLVGIAAITSRRYVETGREDMALRLDRRLLPVFLVAYTAIVTAMVLTAVL